MVFGVKMVLCSKYVKAKDTQRGNRTVYEKWDTLADIFQSCHSAF